MKNKLVSASLSEESDSCFFSNDLHLSQVTR